MSFMGANVERFFLEVLDSDAQFHLVRMEGKEGISKLFQFNVEVVCENGELNIEELIDKAAVITLLDGNNGDQDQIRYAHGIVSQIEIGQLGISQSTYYVTVVPKIWPLTYRQNSRIFQFLSVEEIVTTMLEEAGLNSDEFRFELSASLAPRDYCVQYQETDMQFIARLLEDEGIHYFFEHTQDMHVLVMSDTSTTNPQLEREGAIEYFYDSQGEVREQHIFDFRYIQAVKSGKVTLRDYDFKKPKLKLEEIIEAQESVDLEVYDYPGLFKEAGQGKNYANIRLQALNSFKLSATGASDVNTLNPGYSFNLAGHEVGKLNSEYLITDVEHVCVQTQVLEVGATDEGTQYNNTFRCIPFAPPFRPGRDTLRPIINGTQTATVTGPDGEELYTDEFGRIKVQFHWDREGLSNQDSSCWIRVSQPAAGEGFGGFFLPRIGEEVVVDFLNGNPDMPIVIGRVYHGVNRPPYQLPKHKTRSTIKTNSSKGGKGFNEFRIEDKKGEEQIFMHAEKDMDVRIKNDYRDWIGHDRHQMTINNSHEEIQGSFYGKTVGDEIIEVEGNTDRLYKSDLIQETQGSEHYTVADQHVMRINGDDHLKVASAQNIEIGTKQSIKVGQEIHVKAGQTLVLDAGNSITIKAGGSFITIGPSGVSISGSTINIVGGGTVNIKGGAVNLNSGGSAGSARSAAPSAPANPNVPAEFVVAAIADNGQAGAVTSATDKSKPREVSEYSPQAKSMFAASKAGVPFCAQCEAAAAAKA